MTRCALVVIAALGALALAGCLTPTARTSTWEYFDACSENSSFHEWVACGKRNREAACEASRNCSANNAIVAFADNLDQSVQRREIGEPEARRRWRDMRLDAEAARGGSTRSATERGVEAASQPTFCTAQGRSMGC
jgi:hypothetical protein